MNDDGTDISVYGGGHLQHGHRGVHLWSDAWFHVRDDIRSHLLDMVRWPTTKGERRMSYLEICNWWRECKKGINKHECQVSICERRNDLPDEYEPKEREE